MANGGFVSKYIGADIDKAIGAYLNGNTKTTVTVNVSATATSWKTNPSTSSLSSFPAKYYTEIALTGSYDVGNYPDIFLVDNSGVKFVPDVDYSAKNGTFKIYSNTMVSGIVVINGTKTTLEKTT